MTATMVESAAPHQRLAEIQQALRETPDLDGWLFYDFRGSDPLAYAPRVTTAVPSGRRSVLAPTIARRSMVSLQP